MSKEYPCVYFDHEKCTLHGTEPENIDWCVMGPCGSETPSNGDHVRDMTDEELAEFMFLMLDCVSCQNKLMRGKCTEEYFEMCKGSGQKCKEVCLKWLKQPYKEDA